MRLLITAIGKAKASPEQRLYQHYAGRVPWNISLKEHDLKTTVKSKVKEAEHLLASCAGYDKIIALDESGKQPSSNDIAQHIAGWQTQGASSFAFIIGGADGLDSSVLQRADAVWSFGRVTWPHMLVRALLAEQLYRAHSILHNHPYHRG